MPLPSEVRKAKGSKHKVFLSYYHRDDQNYRNGFETAFNDFYITKSVQPGDIDSDNSAEYIKRLIQDGYIEDSSVIVVLVGPKTKCRKHVDWEISAGLNKKVGGYSGLLGILLPTFPLNAEGKYRGEDLPTRLDANVDSGYAALYRWNWITGDHRRLTSKLDEAFDQRVTAADKIRNASIPQMSRNTCE